LAAALGPDLIIIEALSICLYLEMPVLLFNFNFNSVCRLSALVTPRVLAMAEAQWNPFNE